jgi:predicted homoserine dehydrogenase-like protein
VELVSKLRRLEADGRPIRVGIVGCGQMGSGLAHAISRVVGMTVGAIADIEPERAVAALGELGVPEHQIALTEDAALAEDAIRRGQVVVTQDARLLAGLESLDAAVEATGVPDVGARVALDCIDARKPVIMLNAEADVTVGPYLSRAARRAGSIYTVASGDEPGVCKMLYEQALLMGFEVVCLGKGKNNPLNPAVAPGDCIEEARSKDMNPKMLCSFIDGTKTMVEMAAVSNATGLLPDVPGMHGPRADVDELVSVFIPARDGGVLNRKGAVDYSTGRVAPGVFAIVYSDEPRIRKDMKFLTKEEGPYYLHYRPYHLCDLETPQSIAEAVLLREVTVAADMLHSEVVATAKRNLKAGETVEGIGGTDIHGTIYTYVEAQSARAIPLGIAGGGRVTSDIPRGGILTRESFAPDTSTSVYRLREKQDQWLAPG